MECKGGGGRKQDVASQSMQGAEGSVAGGLLQSLLSWRVRGTSHHALLSFLKTPALTSLHIPPPQQHFTHVSHSAGHLYVARAPTADACDPPVPLLLLLPLPLRPFLSPSLQAWRRPLGEAAIGGSSSKRSGSLHRSSSPAPTQACPRPPPLSQSCFPSHTGHAGSIPSASP